MKASNDPEIVEVIKNLSLLQYIQIAETVLSKLPSTMQLPELNMTSRGIRETRISAIEESNVDDHVGDGRSTIEDEAALVLANERDEDLV